MDDLATELGARTSFTVRCRPSMGRLNSPRRPIIALKSRPHTSNHSMVTIRGSEAPAAHSPVVVPTLDAAAALATAGGLASVGLLALLLPRSHEMSKWR